MREQVRLAAAAPASSQPGGQVRRAGQSLSKSVLELAHLTDAAQKRKMLAAQEAFLRLPPDQLDQGLPVAGDVEEDDGLVVQAELAPGKHLEELLQGAQAAGENTEGIGMLCHPHLALMH